MVHEDIIVLDFLEEQMYVFVNITCTCNTNRLLWISTVEKYSRRNNIVFCSKF